MPGEILLSTAYLAPVGYFSLISNSEKVLIESRENYIKQTCRNRFTILSATGPVSLSLPVRKGSSSKTVIKDSLIDYSKRWQQVHLRAIGAAYGRSPYFQYYFGNFENILLRSHKYVLDLNDELLFECLGMLKMKKNVAYTTKFTIPEGAENDFRFIALPDVNLKPYQQVFASGGFVKGLSIIDLIFNTGPDALSYL